MRSRSVRGLLVLAVCILFAGHARAQALIVSPAAVVLGNPEATQQVLVRSPKAPADLTHASTYQIADPSIAAVDANGLVQPKLEGKTSLVIKHGQDLVTIAVEVKGLKSPEPVNFENQIMPLLTKSGCNTGGCHGKAEGKAGFKLSVFGFDPFADYDSLVKEARGRRVFASSPDSSLILLKATGQIAHGGGRRFTVDSLPYKRLKRWIVEGAHGPIDPTRDELPLANQPIAGIEVEPASQILALEGTQQLRVTAIGADGRRHCVTAAAEYASNASTIAKVDDRGRIRGSDVSGQAAILVRYLGHVSMCQVTIPRPHDPAVAKAGFVRPPEANFIDKLAWDNLSRLGIPVSDLSDDPTFLRRVFLDTIGTLPTVAEARAFLNDTSADKRAKLIDKLLERPEYADYWAMKWSDLLRVDRDAITPAGAAAMTRWLRGQLAVNRPYDRMVHSIVTARGNIGDDGPAAIYKAMATPEDISRSFSQLFLGIRIQCAQCHHHPSDRWGQEDYFALAGFFTGVGRKAVGGGEQIFPQKGSELKHPRTQKNVPVKALGAEVADFTNVTDRRTVLADWMTSSENPYLPRAIANRLWAHYFARGLVEPLDDMRATNPATNEPLLAALAKHMKDSKYDLKAFTRTLLNSRLYQLAGQVKRDKADLPDEQNFSHSMPRALPAEVLLDAISQATGIAEKFNGWPEGYRAIQLWDNRMPSYFFRIFGRPVRASVCECERSNEPSIAQALHLMNSEEISAKIRDRQGVARRLARSTKTPAEIVDELYLGTLSRFPNEAEKTVMLRVFAEAGDDRQGATEDVLWGLLNSRSFVYNH